MTDSMPAWFWVPAAILLWLAVLIPYVTAMRHAKPDPDPDYSTLDRLDGLDTRG